MHSRLRKKFCRSNLLIGALFLRLLSFDKVLANCMGKKILRSGRISCEEKQIILDEHNRLRQLVALGQIHGQPGAANMMEMLWDDELADVAQKWADSCAETHDNYRNVRRFAVGQNIARTWTTRPPGPYDSEPNWRRQISGWFNEVQHYHTGYSKTTGHYTQFGATRFSLAVDIRSIMIRQKDILKITFAIMDRVEILLDTNPINPDNLHVVITE
ncbi:venom allergen 5-like isoform X3 [Vespa crabro]|uniref:venom allergen 5-like isoform X3 n=1 Tax=Vespa crabro TaxID=7445 RepID=UPI001EFFCF84|nr:venom allergen 5-like isoform X3 [Vespa crabro]